MIAPYSLGLAVVALALAGLAAARTVADTFRGPDTWPGAAVLELLLLGQAVLDLVGLARGHQPGELATHLAYLGVALSIVPVVLVQIGRRSGRWEGWLYVVAMVALVVVIARLQATG